MEKDYTKIVSNFSESLVAQRWRCKGILRNIRGAYATRQDKQEIQIKSWEDLTKVLKEEEVGNFFANLKLTTRGKRDVLRIAKLIINTFPKNKEGKPQIPIGGPRGYLTGMFREACKILGCATQAHPYYGWQALIDRGGVSVSPSWMTSGSEPQLEPVKHFVQVANRRTGFYEYYDYIAETAFEVTIDLYDPQAFASEHKATRMAKIKEDSIPKLLSVMPKMGVGPKSRGSIEWIEIKRIK